MNIKNLKLHLRYEYINLEDINLTTLDKNLENREIHGLYTCRSYIHDNYSNKYYWKKEYYNDKLKDTNLLLFLINKNNFPTYSIENFKLNIKNLNTILKKQNIKPIKVHSIPLENISLYTLSAWDEDTIKEKEKKIKSDPNEILLIEGDPIWTNSIFLNSVYTFLLKIFVYIENKNLLQINWSTFARGNESLYLTRINNNNYFNFIINNIKLISENLKYPLGKKGDGVAVLHNDYGFVNTAPQMHTFFKIPKDNTLPLFTTKNKKNNEMSLV